MLESKENIGTEVIRAVNWASFCLQNTHKFCYTSIVIHSDIVWVQYQLSSSLQSSLTGCFKFATFAWAS